ncbi:archaetidylserine decarboxylase [Candidatus Doolittlea endobia]|uniref:Phosphatidylserine decarboxylase proenzyme n=1 Tax=Candidatus Doolittlea endobia TaxID=1778262 RepID=A0A143WSH3_9ENTR|nr:archaetidylserine decarboxylase [Candidatus Doolittlea endobia]CUX96724.1 Phosphatidylserine decarboxylase proenzyme [Candidatus Doolittlea endobia]
MLERVKIALQPLLPKRWLTELAGWVAERRGGWLTYGFIMLFVRWYKINMQEAQQPDMAAYPTFNAFFVRPLRDEVRLIDADPTVLVLPADGIISQLGSIEGEKIFQAKRHYYSLEALLAGNKPMIARFCDGNFITIYLAPCDYHRVHMPCNGALREMLYVPGTLFSVNPLMAANIPNLFARNERVLCLFDTDFGSMMQILVGATIVGSIETVWAGTITPPRERIIKRWRYPQANADGAVVLLKGQEMGRFKLGSTVINLFSGKNVQLGEHLYPRYVTRVGQQLARGIVQTDSPLT